MKREPNRDFQPKKKADSDSANFFAFVAGMATAFIILMMTWNYFTAPTSIERVLKAADNADPNPLSASHSPVNAKDFDDSLTIATAEQLEVLLVKLNNWNRSAELSVRMSENQKRVKVADQMLRLPLSLSRRNFAVNSKIEALSALYGLDYFYRLNSPDVVSTLRAMAAAHLSDKNEEIAQAAKLANIKVESFEYIKSGGNSKLDPVVQQMLDLLKEYPDNEYVLSNLKLILVTLVQFDLETGVNAMRKLTSQAGELKTPATSKFIQSLSDQILLFESKLEKLFDNRYVNGETGQRELLKTALALAAEPSGSAELLTVIENVAVWFEQDNKYERALEIYKSLENSTESRMFADDAVLARRFGKNGQRRCNLVGQKIDINGQFVSAKRLDKADFENRIVVVFFWSAKDASSIKALTQFHAYSDVLASKQVRVLAVCVDDGFDKTIEIVAASIPQFQILVNPAGIPQPNSILEQCPVDQVPQAMLINHHGEVDDVNVPMDELRTAVEFLTTRRFDSK